MVDGPWLSGWITFAALLSAAGLFLSNLLTNSRLPFVLSQDHLLPRALAVLHPRYATPWVAILASSGVYSLLALLPFTKLVVLDVWLYSLALLVQMAAFLAIRLREPALPRPWRIPGGLPIALLVVAVPSLLALLAIATSGLATMLAGLAAALTGPLAYAVFARLGRGKSLMTAQDKSQAVGEQDWGFERSNRRKAEP
jgi:amino acid transporter